MKVLVILMGMVIIPTLSLPQGGPYQNPYNQYRGTYNQGYRGYVDNTGRYIHDDSGRYIPDFSGRYAHDGTGRYLNDGSGRYDGSNDHYKGEGSYIVERTTLPPPPPPVLKTYDDEGHWKILRQLADFDTSGGYHWEYETENKIQAEESGKLFHEGTDKEGIKAKGFFEYEGPDSKLYRIDYTADENGFTPIGDHIPTTPPTPPLILRALKLTNQI